MAEARDEIDGWHHERKPAPNDATWRTLEFFVVTKLYSALVEPVRAQGKTCHEPPSARFSPGDYAPRVRRTCLPTDSERQGHAGPEV